MALVMFRCFQCEYISSSMQEVKIHIQLEHKGGIKYSESCKGLNFVEIGRSTSQDSPRGHTEENLHGSMKWTHDMGLFLIECYKKNEDKFQKPGYTSKQVWNIISKDFSQKYSAVSGESCNEKWRNMKRSYRRIKENLQTAGSRNMKFQYYEEMDDILSKRPEIIRPVTINESSSFTDDELAIRKEINAAVDATEKEVSDASTSIVSPRKRKRQTLPHCCAHFLQEMKKLENAREISEQKRHEEKMALLRELIDIKKQKLHMLQK